MRKWTRTPPPGARVLSAGDEDLTEPFSPCHVICRTQLSQRPQGSGAPQAGPQEGQTGADGLLVMPFPGHSPEGTEGPRMARGPRHLRSSAKMPFITDPAHSPGPRTKIFRRAELIFYCCH